MIDRKSIPQAEDFVRFTLPKPGCIRLNNGIPVYLFENNNLELIHFALRVRAGSLFENEKYVAASAYSLLMESAKGRTSNEVEDFLDFYGSAFNVSVSMEFVTINFLVPKKNCVEVLPFIFSFITAPHYQEENLLYFKQRKIKELEYNTLKVGHRSNQLMYHTLLNPNIPVGTILQKQHIENISLEQMHEYHTQTFCAENLSLFVTGNVDEQLLGIIEEQAKGIKNGTSSVLPVLFPLNRNIEKKVYEYREDSMQSSVVLCRKLFSYTHPDRREFSVLSTILGGYFGSRLMQNLREKNGYTYGVYNAVNYFGEDAIFYIDTDVNVDKTGDAVTQCYNEMERLSSEKVGADELNTVKNYMTGALLRKLDGSVNYMKNYMLWSSAGLDETELEKDLSMINTITPERILELAAQYLQPDDFTDIVVGEIKN